MISHPKIPHSCRTSVDNYGQCRLTSLDKRTCFRLFPLTRSRNIFSPPFWLRMTEKSANEYHAMLFLWSFECDKSDNKRPDILVFTTRIKVAKWFNSDGPGFRLSSLTPSLQSSCNTGVLFSFFFHLDRMTSLSFLMHLSFCLVFLSPWMRLVTWEDENEHRRINHELRFWSAEFLSTANIGSWIIHRWTHEVSASVQQIAVSTLINSSVMTKHSSTRKSLD